MPPAKSGGVEVNSDYPALMKKFLLLTTLLVASVLSAAVPTITPAEAAKRVASGQAVIVDVREPSEWAESGVAAPAALLPKSEFDAGQIGEWKDFLAHVGDKEVILYCRSGRRSAAVATALAEKGFTVANAGAFKDWQAAGLPVRSTNTEKK